MKKIQKLKLIKEYQEPGALNDFDQENYKEQENAIGWDGHIAGTYMVPGGKMFLGMPKGFCRTGLYTDMKLMIFENYDQFYAYYDLPYNVPVWKHLDKNGNTLVRGLCPRINTPFLAVIAGDCRDRIECIEITQLQIDEMD